MNRTKILYFFLAVIASFAPAIICQNTAVPTGNLSSDVAGLRSWAQNNNKTAFFPQLAHALKKYTPWQETILVNNDIGDFQAMLATVADINSEVADPKNLGENVTCTINNVKVPEGQTKECPLQKGKPLVVTLEKHGKLALLNGLIRKLAYEPTASLKDGLKRMGLKIFNLIPFKLTGQFNLPKKTTEAPGDQVYYVSDDFLPALLEQKELGALVNEFSFTTCMNFIKKHLDWPWSDGFKLSFTLPTLKWGSSQ